MITFRSPTSMGSTSPISPAASDEAALLSTPEAGALAALPAVLLLLPQPAKMPTARMAVTASTFLFSFIFYTFFCCCRGGVFRTCLGIIRHPRGKVNISFFSALDARFLFRYNKNESRTHSIATDFKIERNFP
ncbi:MAG: hypothetical protein ACLUVA_03350 [Faecalibacterium sp.]